MCAAQDMIGSWQEIGPRIGQRHLVGAPQIQLCANRHFKLGELLGQRRLRQSELFGSLREGIGMGYRPENPQLM